MPMSRIVVWLLLVGLTIAGAGAALGQTTSAWPLSE
jgi:hypothetical protein